ncbi:MAG TPA: radical SAM protein [Myxococcota bacterium]|nr:radical SAM protein [Myxococcota bacterium]HQK50188.1 radical SAM protein [Myxococcota bacterium]
MQRDRAVFLQRTCPLDGATEVRLSRDADWYHSLSATLHDTRSPRLIHSPLRVEDPVRGVFVDVTSRCNLHCPNCLSNVQPGVPEQAPTLPALLESLRAMHPARPVVYLGGGEPTIRPDLPEWIRVLRAQGHAVKLLTNGLRLADIDYCRALQQAGVTWVCLQFDSLEEGHLARIRGRRGLSRARQDALRNLSTLGMNVDLACMIDRETNFHSLGDLVRLGLSTPGVRHVSLMPSRRIGRGRLTDSESFLEDIDLVEALEDQTDGAVTRQDWLWFQRITSAIYRLTGRADWKPRRCFLALPLVGEARRFAPWTRPWKFAFDTQDVEAVLRTALHRGPVEEARWSERTLLLSIESFWEPENIDLLEASRCNRYYLVDGTLRQACIYNVLNRPVREWPGVAQSSGSPRRMSEEIQTP